jgi:hypothetical protein
LFGDSEKGSVWLLSNLVSETPLTQTRLRTLRVYAPAISKIVSAFSAVSPCSRYSHLGDIGDVRLFFWRKYFLNADLINQMLSAQIR